MDGGAWWTAVHAKGQTRLTDFPFTFHFHALEKEMATHSSALAWRIPGTGEPGGLPSLGSHRVRHDWSDLAAAAAIFLCMDGPHFVSPSVCRTPFDYSEWCCHEHGCKISVWVPAFNSFGCIPRSGMTGSYGRTMFSFWGTVRLFSMMAALFYIPISNAQVFEFLHVLTNICYFRFLKEYV